MIRRGDVEEGCCADRKYPIDLVSAWMFNVFVAAGLRESDACNVADNLSEAERRGVRSHGLLLVPIYLDRIRWGGIDIASKPEIVSSVGCLVSIDGKGGVGQSVAFLGARLAAEIASNHGVGVVNIQNSNHVGMLASYALAITSHGYACIVLTNAGPSMAAHGGLGAGIGNNALCFGFPGSPDPLIIDMAVGTVACGRVRIAALHGLQAGNDWLMDRDGRPTTDPAALDQGGCVVPFAAHKGYAIAVAIDVMTGLLGGGITSPMVRRQRQDRHLPQLTSQTIVAINSQALGDHGDFTSGVGRFVELLRSLPPRDGYNRVLAPGDPELEYRRDAEQNGIVIPPGLMAVLRARSLELGISPF